MKIFCNRDYFPFKKDCHKILLIMKLAIILSLVTIIQTTASVYSQKVTLDIDNVPMREVLKNIEDQSNFRFFYNDKLTGLNKKVSIKASNENVTEVLNQILGRHQLSFKIIENDMIIIAPAEITQQIKLSGSVADAATGEPLIGANVVINGTTVGVITDLDGKFSITVPNNDVELVITSIGYLPEKIKIARLSTIDVKLVRDIRQLEEVVVVGYGTQKKITVTGSVTSVSATELKQTPATNLTNALAGKLPGLIATQYGGGEPGVDGSELFVRGISTYNSGNNSQKPIVIVDGIERSFSNLNSDEVESVTLLKDASATAIYGVRGANGVILVTTKRGKISDRANVTFKASSGISSPIKFPEYLGSADYAMLYNEAVKNDALRDGVPTSKKLFSDEQITNYRKAKGDNSDGLGYNIDLFDYAFKPSIQQDYSLSIRGGSQKVRYFVLAGYTNQKANYKHTDLSDFNTNAVFNRYNFRSNVDIDITKNFYFKLDVSGRVQNRIYPGTTAARIIQIANTQPSIYPIVLPDVDIPENRTFRENNPKGLLFGTQLYRYNILGELAYSGFKNEYQTFMEGTFAMGHKLDFITQGLKADVQFSYDSQAGNTIDRSIPHESVGYAEFGGYPTFYPSVGVDVLMDGGVYNGAYVSPRRTVSATMNNGIAYDTPKPQRINYGQASLTYARSFGKNNISAFLMGNRRKRQLNNEVAFANQGVSFRGTYNYNEKYLFEVNAAYNGSENFAKGKRYGLFPAVSAGWVITNEPFMKNQSIISHLKLRGSFGVVGSDQLAVNRFLYLQFYTTTSDKYQFGDGLSSDTRNTLTEGALANPELTWEKERKTNVGMDVHFFNDKLSLSVDAFYNYRYDIPTEPGWNFSKNASTVIGKGAPQLNIGEIENKGIEIEMEWRDKFGEFMYYIRPNFQFYRNKILFYNENTRISPTGNEVPWAYRTGNRIGEQFVYVFDHFVKDQAEADDLNAKNYQSWGKLIPGDVVYRDIDGDGKITDQEDRIAMGNPRTPEIMFGAPIGLSYKGFDLSVLFQGAANTSVLLKSAAAYDFPVYAQDVIGRVKNIHLQRWTPETAETAKYPALHYGAHDNNKNENSSLFLKDASYVRLKSFEIGYSIPLNLLKKVGLSSTRIYIQGLNLYTWDKLKDFDVDPETNTGGDWYPIQRVFNVGVDVTF